MNESKVVIYEGHVIKVVKTNEKTDYYIDGEKLDRFGLLALAGNSESKDVAWEILNYTSRLFHWQNDWVFNSLYDVVCTAITAGTKKARKTV